MDNSEQYVKMCIESFPDLKKHVPYFSRRRFMHYVLDEKSGLKIGLWSEIVNSGNYEKACALWDQDQLQDMIIIEDNIIIKDEDRCHFLLKYFFDAVNMNWKANKYYWQFKTMEQLWLAFVMSSKYQKTWNENTWIKT